MRNLLMNQNSESYFQLLSKYTPCGSQTLSKMPSRFVEGVYPKVLDRGYKGHVSDVDGNMYVDLISGLGALSVGYAVNEINEALYEQLEKGVSFSLPTVLEYEVSRALCELVKGTDQWKFGKNGTDGNSMAVRAARAITKRTKILTVGYNGCADQFEIKGTRNAGIPKELQGTIDKLEYGSLPPKTFEYACLLMEPMVYQYPTDGYLETLKDWCLNTGTLLIFDEVVTGGRFKGFTAQSYFGVMPDITVLGKGIANGLPLCAVGARRSIMSVFERDDFFASHTFGGETLSLRACLATVKVLQKNIDNMIWNGQRIQEAFNKLYNQIGAKCIGYPTRLVFDFPNPKLKALFMQEMCLNGILIGSANFIMASHTDKDITEVINSIYKAYVFIRDYIGNPDLGLKGAVPVPAIRS